jgi:hypothetical protein
MKKVLIFFLITISITQFAYSQNNSIPIDTMKQYFDEIKAICIKDNGKLWGKNLWSPIIVIDRNTRYFVANENNIPNSLKQENNVFTGFYPDSLIIANSTTDFAGKFWTMVAFPLPKETTERQTLFTHEMFHHLQNELLTGNQSYNNQHIDNKDARILLKLEWNALNTAIGSKKKQQKQAINDALIFNYYRKQLYVGSDTMETKFEILEGLAEYTAVKLCISNKNDIITRLQDKKTYFWNLDTYLRSFGYYSGILYAFLLDFSNADWRNQINTNSSLQKILQNQLDISLPTDLKLEYEKIKFNYGFDTISVYEVNREIENKRIIVDYIEKLTIKQHLTLKLVNRKIGFNPTNLISVDTLGTIFPNVQIIDDWGILKVQKGGCLLDKLWLSAKINAENITINKNIITCDNWELVLNEKWKIELVNDNYELKYYECRVGKGESHP